MNREKIDALLSELVLLMIEEQLAEITADFPKAYVHLYVANKNHKGTKKDSSESDRFLKIRRLVPENWSV